MGISKSPSRPGVPPPVDGRLTDKVVRPDQTCACCYEKDKGFGRHPKAEEVEGCPGAQQAGEGRRGVEKAAGLLLFCRGDVLVNAVGVGLFGAHGGYLLVVVCLMLV